MAKKAGKMPWGSSREGRYDAPALTLMESPAFRVRLSSARPGRKAKLKGFIGRIKALTRKHAAGAGGISGRRLSQFGRGGSAAAGFRVRVHPQRVTVKSRVVRHSRYRGFGGAGAAIAKHIDYLGRAGVAEEGGRGVVFDAARELKPEELKRFRDAIVTDRHHFRFIVSPEAGPELDLKVYAREFVAAMEADVATPLQWVGVAHYDTDNPHLHLLVRGKDARGADLVINRAYMSHGMRLRAGEVATQHLGPRLPEDIERSVVRDLTADRVTAIDLELAQGSAQHAHGWVSALRSNDGSLSHERRRLHTLTRLQHLESLGLAREIRPGIWQPDIDLVSRLRRLSIRGDIIKLMHERMGGSNPSLTTVILDHSQPPTEPVIGRVSARGTADELSDAQYLLIEARDGKAYYVALDAFSELSGQESQVGSIVRLAPTKGQAPGAETVERLSLGNLEAQVIENGVTWLDQEIARGVELTARPKLGALRFERELSDALQLRAQHLGGLGLGELIEGRFRARAPLIDALYARELDAAGRRLQSLYGEQIRLREGLTLKGRIEALESLPSGPHAIVTVSGRYALVPATSDLSQQLGRSISINIGRGRRFDPMAEGARKLSVRYEVLDLKRSRRIGSP